MPTSPAGGLGFEITELYVFAAVHADGDEGVIAAPLGDAMMPLVAADRERLKILRPIARAIGEAAGMQVKLLRFTHREELEP